MSENSSQIEVSNLWKVFGENPQAALQPECAPLTREEIRRALGVVVGLRDVSFSVDTGQVFVVMGLSGSGKSTLVRCLIRLAEPTAGQVCFDGEDIGGYSPKQLVEFRRSKTAMVFQHYGLLPHRNVIDNVAYGLEVRGMDRPSRYEAALEATRVVGLEGWEHNYPREMSGGMQQRVGLARALATNPDVLLMDEPFSGLDPLIRREMQDELLTLQTELRKTIVFITHDLNEALKLGDRIAIMRDGEIIQMGLPEEVVTLPTDAYVTDFVRDVSRAKVLPARAIMREPSVVIYERQGPRAALYAMNQHGLDAVFLIARDFTLKGVLTAEEASELLHRRKESLEEARIVPATTTAPEAYIEEVVPMAAQTEHPIAVVGEHGSLLGEIDRATLLTGLSGKAQEDKPAAR
ncbi:MAG: glycine betaine/L-proline ABC transporter ATP-binding protein [Gammaproteobacteria bacterium]|nr:glycine betaine/L-proline ABC transporter ATP-binding protein [Gammaproteobacteria bacterium]